MNVVFVCFALTPACAGAGGAIFWEKLTNGLRLFG